MYWRRPARQWRAGKGEGNRRALKRLVDGGNVPGILALRGEEAVGWCAVSPRRELPRLAGSRILAPVDEEPVWCISCLFVAKGHRRRGISRALVAAACRHARERGGRIVEGYPHDEAAGAADAFVWTGLLSSFTANGFVEVARRSPKRPVVRREWKP